MSDNGDADAGVPAGGEPLSTGCDALDDLLGGGIERGTVTQVYGPPAAGKTNLALSTAVRTAADGGFAVYVDTEGLSTDRFRQLAEATVAGDRPGSGGDGRPSSAAGPQPQSHSPSRDSNAGAARSATPDVDADALADVTSRIVVTEAYDFDEQEEAVRDVAEFAPRADLVVLDSATGFYRLERRADDEGAALRRLARQVTHLLSLARKHDLAVVTTNQVFTDPDADRTRALGGHTLDHWCGVVLRLDRFRGGNRRATLEKHRSRPAGETARFRIVDGGLAGVEDV